MTRLAVPADLPPTIPIPDSILKEAKEMDSRAVAWDESIGFAKSLMIDGGSYQEWIRREMPWSTRLKPTLFNGDKTPHKSIGNFRLYNAIFPKFRFGSACLGFLWYTKPRWCIHGIRMHNSCTVEGMAYFTCDVTIPILAGDDWQTWMSPTPNEVFTLRRGLRYAKGRVLVGGLGMGWFAKECARRKQVDEVVVVEKDPAIIGEFSRHLPGNVSFMHGDAYEYADSCIDEFDSILFDIWRGMGDAGSDSRWQRLKAKAKGKGKSAWGWTDWSPRGR